MYFHSHKRNCAEAFNPWKRDPTYSSGDISDIEIFNQKRQKFYFYPANEYLDIYSKRAALKASASVVSLQSYSGEKELFQTSGTIIESNTPYSIVLTAASLLRCPTRSNSVADNIKVIVHLCDGGSFDGQIEAYDFHYNIAVIKIQSEKPLPSASLAYLNDSITVDPSEHHVTEHKSFQLRQHSNSFDLNPGDSVIALGCFLIKPYNVMAAPGEFSVDCCDYDCKELFMATCRIMRCGIGGPLINRYGEVLGICFYDVSFTAVLPINVASMWWEHYKKSDLESLERTIQKFPNVLEGVIVEEAVPGSSADSAGIKCKDVIIQFDGVRIQSFLELFEKMWNKVGESVELAVIRASDDVPLPLSMTVDEVASDKLYRLLCAKSSTQQLRRRI